MLSGLLKSLPSFVAPPPLGPVLPSPRRSFFLLVSTWPTPFQKNLFHVQFTSSYVRTFLHGSDGWLSRVRSNKKLSKKHHSKLHRKSAFLNCRFPLGRLWLSSTSSVAWHVEARTINTKQGTATDTNKEPLIFFSETLIIPTEQHVRYQTLIKRCFHTNGIILQLWLVLSYCFLEPHSLPHVLMFLDLLAKFSKLPVIPITKLYFNSLKHKIGANLKLFTGYTLVAFISLAVEDSLKDFCWNGFQWRQHNVGMNEIIRVWRLWIFFSSWCCASSSSAKPLHWSAHKNQIMMFSGILRPEYRFDQVMNDKTTVDCFLVLKCINYTKPPPMVHWLLQQQCCHNDFRYIVALVCFE